MSLGGGNNLMLTGQVDLVANATINVTNAVEFELAGGVGELASAVTLNKGGSGFLTISAPAYYSGATTINALGGELRLTGGGKLVNTASITVQIGGTFSIDNAAGADTDRVRNAANVTLNGGAIELVGHAAAAVNEIVGTLTTNANFTSFVTSDSQGAAAKLSFAGLTRQSNSFILFNGQSASTNNDLGSILNQVLFLNPPTNLLLNGILPFAALRTLGAAGQSDLEFVGYSALVGITAVAAVTTLAGATAKDNVKLSASEALAATTNVNALLIVGNGRTISGTSALTVESGLVLNFGNNNTISAPLNFGGQTALIDTVTAGQTLSVSSVLDGQAGLVKFGPGALSLSGANTYAGTTTIFEGAIRISNSSALGVSAGNLLTHGTTVQTGAALEIDGSGGAVNVGEEALSLSGLGFGYGNQTTVVSGNGGALRNIAGTNSWLGNITLPNTASLSHALGSDAGTLALNGQILTGVATLNLFKVGGGTVEFGGAPAQHLPERHHDRGRRNLAAKQDSRRGRDQFRYVDRRRQRRRRQCRSGRAGSQRSDHRCRNHQRPKLRPTQSEQFQ